ncbi:MAG: hypothetical protein NZL90_01890, partial [Aquificaceae bacterium]|nr:hypothetical protein [Aquificaceae bacterium]
AFKSQLYTEALYHKVLAVGFRDLSVVLHFLLERVLIDGLLNYLSRSYLFLVGIIWKGLDKNAIDRLVILSASSSRSFGKKLSSLQNGLVNNYVIMLVAGLAFLLTLMARWKA